MITMVNNKREYRIPCIFHQRVLFNRRGIYWDQLKDQFMSTSSPLAWVCGVLAVFGE